MTFLSYNTGQITYVVCPSCWAWANTTTQLNRHHCDRDWPRFLRTCNCGDCRTFRGWANVHEDV